MTIQSSDLAHKKASQYFQQGYNCSQSVLRAGSEALGLALPPEIIKATAGFSGGIGFSGCLCGALAGAAMLLGLKLADGQPGPTKGLAKKTSLFYQWFENEFSSPCCRVIREGRPFSHKEVRELCTEVTAETARKAVEMLVEG